MPIVVENNLAGLVAQLSGNAGMYNTRADQAAQARQAQQLAIQERSVNANIANQQQQMAMRQQQQAMLERQYRDQRGDSERQRQQAEYQAFQDSLPSTQLRNAQTQAQAQQMQNQPMLNQVQTMQQQGLIDDAQAGRWTGSVIGGRNPFGEQTTTELQQQQQSKVQMAMQNAEQQASLVRYREEQANLRKAAELELKQSTSADPGDQKEYTRGQTLHKARVQSASEEVKFWTNQFANAYDDKAEAEALSMLNKARNERNKAEGDFEKFLETHYDAVRTQKQAGLERAQDGIAIVKNKAQYDSIPKGTRFYDDQGNLREKK